MMYWSDDPVRDAERWEVYKETQRAMREARCEKCRVCGKAIDPEEDNTCLNLIDAYAHVQCVGKLIEKSNLPDWLKTIATEGIEETYYEITPPVEE